MSPEERLDGSGGSFLWNSTQAYEVTGDKDKVYWIEVHGYSTITVLEVNGVDYLAKHGLVSGKVLKPGVRIGAKKGQSFTKIQFSVIDDVTFWCE